MDRNNLLQQSPMQLVTFESYQHLLETETTLQTIVRLLPESQESFKLRLKDQHVLLSPVNDSEEQASYFIRLNFSVKFQKILASIENPGTPTPITSQQLKGIRLIHENGAQISFYIQFADLTNIWVKFLSKHINQLGFHKCFKPIRKLGKGGSASVYEVIKLENSQRLAAKVFSKQILKNSPQKFYSFKNQIEILRNLEHKNLLKFEGVFETDHSFYLILEVLKGGNLLEYLMRRKTFLNIEETRTIMRNLVKGLAELEKHEVVHRDIKLENVMLRDKDSLEPVIVDFGLAVYFWEDDYVFKNCGTPGYLSPEVIKSENGSRITTKSDVFSAGVVLHVLLTGRYLFNGKDPRSVFESNRQMNINLSKPEYNNLDKCAYDLLRKMLAIDCSQRFTSSECLEHPFLKEETTISEDKFQVSPASTTEDYHF